jgi:hypothetical protein
MSTAIIVGVNHFGFIASADPVDDAQVKRAHIAPAGPMSQEQAAHLKQASATMQKSVRTSQLTDNTASGKAGTKLRTMQDDLTRLNSLSENLDKGKSRFLDFAVNEQEKLEQEGWRVKGFQGLAAKSQSGDMSGLVGYNREKNIITVVYNGTADDTDGRKVTSKKLIGEVKDDLYAETVKQLNSVADQHGSDTDFADLKKFVKSLKAKNFGKDQLNEAQDKVQRLVAAKKIDAEEGANLLQQLRAKADFIRYLEQTGCKFEGTVSHATAKQYYSTKQEVLSVIKDITDGMSDAQRKTVKVVVSGGTEQANAVGSLALADLTANHGKELFGQNFDNKTWSTFHAKLDSSADAEVHHADTKQYRATEAEFVKTAQKIEKAQAKHKNTDELMAEFVDLGTSLYKQAQDGAQVELMAEALEKGVSKMSVLKDKFDHAKATVKQFFAPLQKEAPVDEREELNVLCLDGGGVRGIGTLLMLVDLEMRTGKKVHEMFDRIYGTSTGGLMAIMLARGMSATEVLDVYFNNMEKIFYRSWSDTFLNPMGLVSATYNPAGLESVINQYVGDARLQDVKIPVAVTCVDKADQNKVRLLSSDSKKTQNVKIMEAARATSAAPTYFPAQEVNLDDKKFMAVDGGVAANNPSEEALGDIWDKFGKDKYKINLVSLGTGTEDQVQIHDQGGKLTFGSPGNIPGYFMGTNERKILKHVKKAHKRGDLNSYHRFNFALPFAIDLADTSETAKANLLKLAYQRTQQADFKAYVQQKREQER